MEPKESGAYVMSFDQTSPVAAPYPLEGFFNPEQAGGQSISGPSFLRRQKENTPPCYPVSALAWLLLRDVCDWYDADFTQDGEETSSPTRSISIRLLLLFVPLLALVDAFVNFLLCIFLFPLLILKCCYPFKSKLITARKKGSPTSCCCLHEACDPALRVCTSLMLVFSAPWLLAGICVPQNLVERCVYWADGHTAGYIYLDRQCLCCSTQYPCGLFFRNRAVGDVMT